MENLQDLQEKLLAGIRSAAGLKELDELRVAALGKKGSITEKMKTLGTLPPEEKIAAGKALEACFQAGGCNASFDEDVRPYIWKKVIANSGYNGVSAVMRLKVKETFADPYGHDIVMHVWKEGCAVAQALGIGDLWPLMEKEEPNIIANLGNYYPSMAQDAVLHQRQTEISVLNGAIARYGERLGVPTPFNTVITKVISCIQNNYDKQYLG